MKQTKIFPAQNDQLRYLCQFVVAGAEQARLDGKACSHIELSCDEAATNIVEHAYGGDGRGNIITTWEIVDRTFRVTLEDSGKPFRPNRIPKPLPLTEHTPVEVVQLGGLGVHLMRQLMDDVIFEFEDGKNRVILVKKLPKERNEPIWHEAEDALDVVGVVGRLDQLTIPDLESQMVNILAESRYRIILDLSDTTYTNSGGLRVIVAAWREARQHDGDVILTGLSEQLREIFEMVGFDKILTIVPTVEEARQQFS